MAIVNCPNEDKDKYTSKDGLCCYRCAAGQHVQADCSATKTTQCAQCGRGFYTNTKNHLKECLPCKVCSRNNNHQPFKNCTAQEDTVCECVPGFYCSNNQCNHCQLVAHCPLGVGVKVQATRTSDTICAPCEDGTYSNVTDSHSRCQAHTRCEDFGRVLKTPGTTTTNAICGDFKSHCPWVLPAGLWSGLVLTALVLFGLVCWRAKRKSYKAASSSAPASLVEVFPVAAVTQLSLPFTELKDHCQESCAEEGCTLPLFKPDAKMISCACDTQDSVDSSLPITPLKVSVSFIESSHTNGNAGNFLRSYSEPQEDEWCGT